MLISVILARETTASPTKQKCRKAMPTPKQP
jgi:hypothetical protein